MVLFAIEWIAMDIVPSQDAFAGFEATRSSCTLYALIFTLRSRMYSVDFVRSTRMCARRQSQLGCLWRNLIWKRRSPPNCAQPFPMVGATPERWTRDDAIRAVNFVRGDRD